MCVCLCERVSVTEFVWCVFRLAFSKFVINCVCVCACPCLTPPPSPRLPRGIAHTPLSRLVCYSSYQSRYICFRRTTFFSPTSCFYLLFLPLLFYNHSHLPSSCPPPLRQCFRGRGPGGPPGKSASEKQGRSGGNPSSSLPAGGGGKITEEDWSYSLWRASRGEGGRERTEEVVLPSSLPLPDTFEV